MNEIDASSTWRTSAVTRRRLSVAILTKGSGAALAFLGFVLLAAATSLNTFGLVGSIFALASIGGVAGSGGLHVAVLRLWPERHRTVGRSAADESTGTAARLTLITGLVGAAATGVVVHTAFDQDLATALPAAVLALLLSVSEYLSGLLRAQDRDLLALIPKDLLWRIGVVFGFGIAAWSSRQLSAAQALWIFVAALATALLLQLPVLFAQLRSARPMRNDTRALLALAGPMWVGALLAACAQLLDVAVVGAFFDGETTALYVAATRISALVALPLVALNQQSGPMIADTFYAAGSPAVQTLFRRFMKFSVASNLALTAIVLVAGRSLLGLFDVDTDLAYVVLAVLVAGNTVDALSGPSSMALQMLGRERAAMGIALLAQGVVVVLIAVGAALDAIVVVALSNVVLQLLRNVPAVVLLRRDFAVDPSVYALGQPPVSP